MTKKWPYVTLNVYPETRDRVMSHIKSKTNPRTYLYERALETADTIINRALDALEEEQ